MNAVSDADTLNRRSRFLDFHSWSDMMVLDMYTL